MGSEAAGWCSGGPLRPRSRAERATVRHGLRTDAGITSGAAYVFERNQGGLGNWGQVKKLTASDAAELDELGWAVAVSGDTLVVAASADADEGLDTGSVYVYAPSVELPTMPIWGLWFLGAMLLLAGTSRL
jgi:hypothetical protein